MLTVEHIRCLAGEIGTGDKTRARAESLFARIGKRNATLFVRPQVAVAVMLSICDSGLPWKEYARPGYTSVNSLRVNRVKHLEFIGSHGMTPWACSGRGRSGS